MAKLAGYVILAISVLIWLMIPVIPFLGLSIGKIVGITTGLVIAGEVTFYAGIFLIGKDFLIRLWNKFRFRKAKTSSETESLD